MTVICVRAAFGEGCERPVGDCEQQGKCLAGAWPTTAQWGCWNRPFGDGCQYTLSEAGKTDAKCIGCKWRVEPTS